MVAAAEAGAPTVTRRLRARTALGWRYGASIRMCAAVKRLQLAAAAVTAAPAVDTGERGPAWALKLAARRVGGGCAGAATARRCSCEAALEAALLRHAASTGPQSRLSPPPSPPPLLQLLPLPRDDG